MACHSQAILGKAALQQKLGGRDTRRGADHTVEKPEEDNTLKTEDTTTHTDTHSAESWGTPAAPGAAPLPPGQARTTSEGGTLAPGEQTQVGKEGLDYTRHPGQVSQADGGPVERNTSPGKATRPDPHPRKLPGGPGCPVLPGLPAPQPRGTAEFRAWAVLRVWAPAVGGGRH